MRRGPQWLRIHGGTCPEATGASMAPKRRKPRPGGGGGPGNPTATTAPALMRRRPQWLQSDRPNLIRSGETEMPKETFTQTRASRAGHGPLIAVGLPGPAPQQQAGISVGFEPLGPRPHYGRGLQCGGIARAPAASGQWAPSLWSH